MRSTENMFGVGFRIILGRLIGFWFLIKQDMMVGLMESVLMIRFHMVKHNQVMDM